MRREPFGDTIACIDWWSPQTPLSASVSAKFETKSMHRLMSSIRVYSMATDPMFKVINAKKGNHVNKDLEELFRKSIYRAIWFGFAIGLVGGTLATLIAFVWGR